MNQFGDQSDTRFDTTFDSATSDSATSDSATSGGGPERPAEPVVIDCDDCAVRGPGCRECVVSVLLGVPETLLDDERAALEVLAEAGLAPRLRLVPIRRREHPGLAG